MTKKNVSTISRNYAQALIDLSSKDNSFELLKNQMCEIKETFENSKDLKIVMENTSVTAAKKNEIIDEIFKNKIDLKLLNLLKILAQKHRIEEFSGIYDAYCELSNKFTNKKEIEIISSINLDDEIKRNILDKLKSKLNCEVIPIWKTDESIIAGLTFKFGDYVIDTSIKSKLEKLSKQMLR